jgi:hypothetical protein
VCRSTQATYRVVVGKKRKEPDDLAQLVQVGLARGMDIVDAFRAATARMPLPMSAEQRQLERAHRQAVEKHRRNVRRHERRMVRLRTRVTAGTVTAAAGVALFLAAVPSPMEAWGFLGLGLGAIGGTAAITARHSLRDAAPPVGPRVPAPPPPPLPAGARGAAESAQLTQLRIQLAQVIPAVERLHPGAGEELRRADAEAAPPLGALVERLAVLDRMERTMPGTTVGAAAAAAGDEIRGRLSAGCATYERLLAASATLLAAPDVGRSTDEVLGPALDAMSAYAEGLATSAQAFSTEGP